MSSLIHKASNNNFRYAVREPDDWCTGPTRSLVMHRPTDAFFVVYPRKRLPRDAFLKLEDFDALLMCVRDGGIGPFGFELERLRREAVVMRLSYLGFVRLIRVSDYAFGEECLVSDGAGRGPP
jgi:hypothetical protein